MGDGDKVELTPEEIREQARKLVKDAGDFSTLVDGAREGFRTAAADTAPWYSAGGWGMFKQPASAANEGDRFATQVNQEVEDMGEALELIMRDLANVDVNSSTELDEIGKVIYSDE